MLWFFGPEAYGILTPQPGIKPPSYALKGKVLTIGPPGKSCKCILITDFHAVALTLPIEMPPLKYIEII